MLASGYKSPPGDYWVVRVNGPAGPSVGSGMYAPDGVILDVESVQPVADGVEIVATKRVSDAPMSGPANWPELKWGPGAQASIPSDPPQGFGATVKHVAGEAVGGATSDLASLVKWAVLAYAGVEIAKAWGKR